MRSAYPALLLVPPGPLTWVAQHACLEGVRVLTQQVASEEAAVGAAHYRYARGVREPGVNGSLRGNGR